MNRFLYKTTAKLLVLLLFSLFPGDFVQRHVASLRSKLLQTELKLTPKRLDYTQIGTCQRPSIKKKQGHGAFRNIPEHRIIIVIIRNIYVKLNFQK